MQSLLLMSLTTARSSSIHGEKQNKPWVSLFGGLNFCVLSHSSHLLATLPRGADDEPIGRDSSPAVQRNDEMHVEEDEVKKNLHSMIDVFITARDFCITG